MFLVNIIKAWMETRVQPISHKNTGLPWKTRLSQTHMNPCHPLKRALVQMAWGATPKCTRVSIENQCIQQMPCVCRYTLYVDGYCSYRSQIIDGWTE